MVSSTLLRKKRKNEESTLEILKFATPLYLNNLTNFIFTLTDSIMISVLGAAALGGVGQGGIYYNVILTFFLGILSMYTPLNSRLSETELKEGKLVSNFWMAVSAGFVFTLLVFFILKFSPQFFTLVNQPYETTEVALKYVNTLVWATFPIFIYNCISQTANVIKKPSIGVIAVVIGNMLNVFFNWVFLYGKFGLPALGVEGVALSTVYTRWGMVILAFLMINKYISPENRLINVKKFRLDLKFFKMLITKGVPKGITNLSDWLISFVLVLMVGWGGVSAVAANQVTDLLSSMMYMVPQAFCIVITIYLSKKLSDSNFEYIYFKSLLKQLLKITLSVSLILVVLVFIFLMSDLLFKPFSLPENSELHEFASNIMLVHLGFFIFYTIQFSMLAILDSFLDTKIPSIMTIFVAYGITLPLALFAHKMGFGAVGIWVADGIGLVIMSILFSIRVRNNLLKLEKKTSDKGIELIT